ncbi:MAG: hypothetical protein ACYSWU_22475 [Planctomycetota bacterium]
MPTILRTSVATPASHSLTFPEFLDYLMKGATRGTRSYALDHGVDEPALIRYANGAVTVYEREEIQDVLSRCAWARDYVVNYVKWKRTRSNRSAA